MRAELERDPERLRMFQEMDELLHASEISTSTAMSIARTLWAGPGRPKPRVSVDALALSTSFRSASTQMLAKCAIHAGLIGWTYRDFSIEEVRTYTDSAHDAARAYLRCAAGGPERGYGEAGLEIGRAFARLPETAEAGRSAVFFRNASSETTAALPVPPDWRRSFRRPLRRALVLDGSAGAGPASGGDSAVSGGGSNLQPEARMRSHETGDGAEGDESFSGSP
jgi:hypothetical protein